MTDGTGSPDPRQAARRRAGLLAALAGSALLVAACGGGPPPAGPGAAIGPDLSVQLDAYAQCVRAHGVPDFYISRMGSTPPPPGQTQVIFRRWVVPADPSRSAQKACQHLLPVRTPSTAETHQQFLQALKAARCMRSHGYPNWPDPPQGGGVPVPTGSETSSPRFQATARACGAAP